ncbi:unnamed protein product, partial [Rotaria sp. Silwood1]
MNMIKQLLCQIFSAQCQLTYLRLDISNDRTDSNIHECLTSNSNLSSNLIQYQLHSCCMTLRRLHIRLNQSCFLENLIEHVPNLEQISVEFDYSLGSYALWQSNIELLRRSNGNWFNKILKSFIDANFIRQYCLPDTIPNLVDFNFYICSECQLSSNDIDKITNSFKIHPFFISHRWTNVNCLFDPIMSCQHLFSSFTNTFQFSNNFINYSYIFKWPHISTIWFDIHPSLYLFLERFNDLSPNISCIKVYK